MAAFGEDPRPIQLAALFSACGQETAEACLTGRLKLRSLHQQTATPESAGFCGVIAYRGRVDSPALHLPSMQRRKCCSSQFATLRPMAAPSSSSVRKWIPPHTRALPTSSVSTLKRLKLCVPPDDPLSTENETWSSPKNPSRLAVIAPVKQACADG